MRMCWITLRVKEMEKSLAFYTGVLGLGICNRYKTPDGKEVVFLADGDMSQVELIQDPSGAVYAGENLSIGFTAASVDDELERMASLGVPVLHGPYTVGGGTRFFYVEDPDGLEVQIVEHGKG